MKFALLHKASRSGSRIETVDAEIRLHQRVAYPARSLDCGCYTVPLVVKRLAVSSHEYPIETWRRVPGFVEGYARPRALTG